MHRGPAAEAPRKQRHRTSILSLSANFLFDGKAQVLALSPTAVYRMPVDWANVSFRVS